MDWFSYFVSRCEYWKQKLGLTDWFVTYSDKSDPDNQEDPAYCRYIIHNKIAVIGFVPHLDNSWEWTQELVDRYALHEMLHLAVAELIALIERRSYNEVDCNIIEHSLIRRLENCLLEFERDEIRSSNIHQES